MVYANLSISAPDLRLLTPDYSIPADEVYAEATRYCILEGENLETLRYCDEPLACQYPTYSHFDFRSRFPSWAIDWSVEAQRLPVQHRFGHRVQMANVGRRHVHAASPWNTLITRGKIINSIAFMASGWNTTGFEDLIAIEPSSQHANNQTRAVHATAASEV